MSSSVGIGITQAWIGAGSANAEQEKNDERTGRRKGYRSAQGLSMGGRAIHGLKENRFIRAIAKNLLELMIPPTTGWVAWR